MFTLDGIRTLHRWTHTSLTVLLDHLSTIPPGSYAQPLPGFGSPTIREQVLHLFNCEGLWVHMLQGFPYRDRTLAECPSLSEARLLQDQVRGQTLDYLSRLSEQQLNSNTELHFPDGDVAVRTPALILHHMLTHAFHHKGQIVAMCRLLGHPAPDTDLNQFE